VSGGLGCEASNPDYFKELDSGGLSAVETKVLLLGRKFFQSNVALRLGNDRTWFDYEDSNLTRFVDLVARTLEMTLQNVSKPLQWVAGVLIRVGFSKQDLISTYMEFLTYGVSNRRMTV
jgi:hypothetical protein